MEMIIIAWRNVFRNKRRSILNIIALTLASGLMVLGLGWVQGYHTYIYKAMQNFESGEVQLIPDGYLTESRRMPLDLNLEGYRDLKGRLKSIEGVREATGRIDFSLRLSNRAESVYLVGRGIDPGSEANTTVLSDYISAGSYLSADEEGILIGKELADRMGVAPGDTVYVVVQDKYGVENFSDIKIAGIFHYGFPPIDKNVVFLDLASAMRMLDMDNQVTRVVMRMDEGISPAEGTKLLQKEDLPGEIHSWKTFAQATVSAVRADTNSFYIILVVLYLLIVLGLLNSMSMSVHERTREIGTLKAIGMKKNQVVALLMTESAWMALISAAAAVLISLPMIWYLGSVGLDISSQMPNTIPVPFGEQFYADFRLRHFLIAFGIATLSGLLGTLRPARRAARLLIAEAMRGGGLG
jgi:ABC-type lipoprotein release transport system permease subunit